MGRSWTVALCVASLAAACGDGSRDTPGPAADSVARQLDSDTLPFAWQIDTSAVAGLDSSAVAALDAQLESWVAGQDVLPENAELRAFPANSCRLLYRCAWHIAATNSDVEYTGVGRNKKEAIESARAQCVAEHPLASFKASCYAAPHVVEEEGDTCNADCTKVDMKSLGWVMGHKTKFCRRMGFDGVIPNGGKYKKGGWCYSGDCKTADNRMDAAPTLAAFARMFTLYRTNAPGILRPQSDAFVLLTWFSSEPASNWSNGCEA